MVKLKTVDVPVRAVYEDGTRVLLIRPGDVLLIGNVGPIRDAKAAADAAQAIKDVVGVRVVLFERDIDVDKLPGEDLALIDGEAEPAELRAWCIAAGLHGTDLETAIAAWRRDPNGADGVRVQRIIEANRA